MFGPAPLLLARELMAGLDPLRIAAVAMARGAALVGARLVSAAVRRMAMPPAPARIPSIPPP